MATNKKARKKDNNELVSIFVAPDHGDTSPVTGSLNGVNFVFPRNKWIQVPRNIAEIIECSNQVLRDMKNIPTEYDMTQK